MKKTILILLLSCMLTGCYNRHEKELALLCDSVRKKSLITVLLTTIFGFV